MTSNLETSYLIKMLYNLSNNDNMDYLIYENSSNRLRIIDIILSELHERELF